MKYCESIHTTTRRKTREVMVGNVGVGGNNPIRIQSMTTSNTRDVDATVEQITKLANAGCEIARITVQGIKEADACEHIKSKLLALGYTIPLVADIHFYPPAAMRAIEFVDKVRINPGNYADKRASFKVIEYDDVTYAEELKRIEEKFSPLVNRAKELKKSIRIGTNHGSLSDRIMNRYGDTPQGMVESALEFARICRKNDFHDFIFSMKASNPLVMILAYRLLTAEMYKLGWDYPLHLGVTEAGEGEDGRIKSAMGMGSLLLDGIGDTIRVSLTEDPWHEIEPCKRLVAMFEGIVGTGVGPFKESFRDIKEISRREVSWPKNLAMHRNGTVYLNIGENDLKGSDFYRKIGCESELGRPKLKRDSADGLVVQGAITETKKINHLVEAGVGVFSQFSAQNQVRIVRLKDAVHERKLHTMTERFKIGLADSSNEPLAVIVEEVNSEHLENLKEIRPSVIFFAPKQNRLHSGRQFFEWLQSNGVAIPVILNFSYECSKEELVINAAAEIGALLCDGFGEGVLIDGPYEIEFLLSLSFGILQSARMRTVKTEFISCPSCGRTLFDLQEVTRRIKEKTNHLPGVKIAIMGCIVNGPGEMADADFGYVGSRPGKIDLYVGKERVEQNIDFADADDRLIDLIKSHGKWIDPVDLEEKIEI
ncbi:MAG: (E)-4-hydroxy-3-methylbut-2-enyl-diphosphate synthase [Chlamydiota bacterium]|nr:(E)-4-hydroxy-3-methylbut-2-enyl-diphosphate synthase [Chlamydiota bacterium]